MKRSTFFVEDDVLCTRLEGKEVRVLKWDRFLKGTRVTPVFPHILPGHLVLVASNRPLAVFHIYSNGNIKEELVRSTAEYTYKLVTGPFPKQTSLRLK